MIGDRITEIRKMKGLSAYKLAKLCGFSESVIDNIEKGRVKDPGFSKVCRIAEALEVSLDKLANDTNC